MSRRSKPRHRGLGGIFAIPLLITLMSGFGLVAALLTDGPLDLLWSLAVAAPVLTIVWAMWRR